MLESFTIQSAAENAGPLTLSYVIMLSFVLSTVLALVYQKTYRGMSYSRNYVQALILIAINAGITIPYPQRDVHLHGSASEKIFLASQTD